LMLNALEITYSEIRYYFILFLTEKFSDKSDKPVYR
jgi:hypothetical protein